MAPSRLSSTPTRVTSEGQRLAAPFFGRDTLTVARELLGCYLCRHLPDGSLARWPLTELEAYDGPEDRACHASRGRTPRNAVLFGPPGHWYVYLCYGVHWLLNIVTGPEDYPAAVLIRGAGEVHGPGRVTKALGIGRAENTRAATPASGLWLEQGPVVPEAEVTRTPRIGVDYAGNWAEVPYRLIWRTPHPKPGKR